MYEGLKDVMLAPVCHATIKPLNRGNVSSEIESTNDLRQQTTSCQHTKQTVMWVCYILVVMLLATGKLRLACWLLLWEEIK